MPCPSVREPAPLRATSDGQGQVTRVFAVLATGGKQYRVAENDRIQVELLDKEAGDHLELKDVLMLGDGKKVTVGSPYVHGASVRAKVLGQVKGAKIDAIVYKRRKRSRRRFGHRQGYTELLIEKISAGSKASSKEEGKETQDEG
jgi:large subunit ribosomal protein L21